jgi:hypothetical protein
MRCLFLVACLVLPACLFTEHGTGGDDDDDCLEVPTGAEDLASEPAPQRNPEQLTCESFGGFPCNPDCGPCPLGGEESQPAVSWGFCGSFCEGLDEKSCEVDPGCRVAKDVACAVSGTCETDFVGCFPTDQFTTTVACTQALDGQTCSQDPACTAFHRNDPCPLDAPCPLQFAFCLPEGQGPGKCFEQAACERLPPQCPSGTVAGVANGCFTDACIPEDLCEPAPDL